MRGDFLSRTHIGLDYFDASINRIAAWVIGMRNAAKALLLALLEPTARLRQAETAGDFTSRLVLMEEAKTLPAGAVWDEYCRRQSVPVGADWLGEVKTYEKDVLFPSRLSGVQPPIPLRLSLFIPCFIDQLYPKVAVSMGHRARTTRAHGRVRRAPDLLRPAGVQLRLLAGSAVGGQPGAGDFFATPSLSSARPGRAGRC